MFFFFLVACLSGAYLIESILICIDFRIVGENLLNCVCVTIFLKFQSTFEPEACHLELGDSASV